MAAETELTDELARLRACVAHVTGALVVDDDGRVLARDVPGEHSHHLGNRTAEALRAALRLADAAGHGTAHELLVRAEHGWVGAYSAGRSAALALVTAPEANVGRLRLEGRRAGARIGALLDSAPEQQENTRP
ncbi:roadblock/LC7 domain-containing protein [Streptomyces rimosus]|uniref:roadblock/LC7 domain-containing protein n=1 Tax=Streptomyces rimosus TaxID=1927 RepID=UPI00067CF48E|nr:roadblock/LC7 domain-containing protein [Streptomyces rimosus]